MEEEWEVFHKQESPFRTRGKYDDDYSTLELSSLYPQSTPQGHDQEDSFSTDTIRDAIGLERRRRWVPDIPRTDTVRVAGYQFRHTTRPLT